MKNNRSTKLDSDFVTKHQLSTDPPPEHSLFWKMWKNNTTIAEKALNTQFIQGIKSGTLNPVNYGAFNISDAYYCFHGAEDYLSAADNTNNPILKAFLLKKYNSYQKYYATFPTTWHIKDANGIMPSDICKEYSEFESEVAQHRPSIYTLIVMIPCEYLWAWLAAQLAPPIAGNLYTSWITENNSPSGAYAMGNFLEYYQNEYPIDETLALQLYTKAMNFEYENFKTAITA